MAAETFAQQAAATAEELAAARERAAATGTPVVVAVQQRRQPPRLMTPAAAREVLAGHGELDDTPAVWRRRRPRPGDTPRLRVDKNTTGSHP